MVKESLEELAHPKYWDERYSKDNDDARVYDWLRNFDSIKPFLSKHLPPPEQNASILHLGTGNSTLPISLATQLHQTNQTALDFSSTCIANMSEAHPTATSHVRWLVGDIRDLSPHYPSPACLDICIDKATLDAMLYGSLWDPPDEVKANVGAYVDEVARVLKPGGKWLYVTWRQPHFIKPLIQREGVWKIEAVESLSEGGGMLEYFGFVVVKL